MENLSGMQFGAYQIVGPLGQGGMAAVYKAYQTAVERYVALKVLPRTFADDPQFQARFSQEARVLAQLQHPFILPVFDSGQAHGYAYIVMPYVPSGTLGESMGNRPQPLPRIRKIVEQVGEALHYAHSRGLIHRDVKPSNILVDESGNCLLTDFGLARIIETAANLTTSGAILGTPAYMSPEQGSGKKLDARTDIYSLGIILYEMATGRVPFSAETPVAVVFKHIQDPLPAPRSLNPNLPLGLERVILKALAKNPDDRYQSARDLVQATRDALQVESELRPPVSGPAPAPFADLATLPPLDPGAWEQAVHRASDPGSTAKRAAAGSTEPGPIVGEVGEPQPAAVDRRLNRRLVAALLSSALLLLTGFGVVTWGAQWLAQRNSFDPQTATARPVAQDPGAAASGVTSGVATPVSPTATTRVAQAPTPLPDVLVDFEAMIFVGGFDPRLWSKEAAAQSTLEQRDGALMISHVPDLERATTRLVLRETFDLQGLEAYEARLALDETNGSGNIHLTLNADSMNWWTQCLIQNDAQPRVSCVATKWPTASFDYQTEFTLTDFGAWHTVRIEVSADPVAFRYFLDDQPIGEYQPPRPERFSETTYTLDVGAWSSTTSVVGRVDDVVVSRRP